MIIFYIVLFVTLVYLLVQTFLKLRMITYVKGYVSKGGYTPSVSLIIPCKNADAGFEARMNSFIRQEYPNYHVVFVTGSETDSAWPILSRMVSENSSKATLLTSGDPVGRSQKLHNLLQGIRYSNNAEVLVFADSDAEFSGNWLQSMVTPLQRPEISATTGCFWLEAYDKTIWAKIWAWIYNTEITPFFANNGGSINFAWGGAIAVSTATFYQAGVDKVWSNTAYDDLPFITAISPFGKVHFVPEALGVTRIFDGSLLSYLRWFQRQFTAGRIYTPHLFLLSAILSLPLVLMLLWPFILLMGVASSTIYLTQIGLCLFFILFARMVLGVLLCLGINRRELAKYAVLDYPGVFLTLVAYSFSLVSNRIVWAGKTYELISSRETRVLS